MRKERKLSKELQKKQKQIIRHKLMDGNIDQCLDITSVENYKHYLQSWLQVYFIFLGILRDVLDCYSFKHF